MLFTQDLSLLCVADDIKEIFPYLRSLYRYVLTYTPSYVKTVAWCSAANMIELRGPLPVDTLYFIFLLNLLHYLRGPSRIFFHFLLIQYSLVVHVRYKNKTQEDVKI